MDNWEDDREWETDEKQGVDGIEGDAARDNPQASS